ncbi:hypothetical protein HMPREF9453_01111, partial [Dialister succinatiphilus YIT 11850]
YFAPLGGPMQDLHSGTIKLRYAVKLLMKGLLFRALFCPLYRGKSGEAG